MDSVVSSNLIMYLSKSRIIMTLISTLSLNRMNKQTKIHLISVQSKISRMTIHSILMPIRNNKWVKGSTLTLNRNRRTNSTLISMIMQLSKSNLIMYLIQIQLLSMIPSNSRLISSLLILNLFSSNLSNRWI